MGSDSVSVRVDPNIHLGSSSFPPESSSERELHASEIAPDKGEEKAGGADTAVFNRDIGPLSPGDNL